MWSMWKFSSYKLLKKNKIHNTKMQEGMKLWVLQSIFFVLFLELSSLVELEMKVFIVLSFCLNPSTWDLSREQFTRFSFRKLQTRSFNLCSTYLSYATVPFNIEQLQDTAQAVVDASGKLKSVVYHCFTVDFISYPCVARR